jgi:uncharacterized protein YbjT (DUF2867 family)
VDVLVIGATGNVGRQVVTQLVERQVSVRALARRPAEAGLPAAVEVVGGDLTELDSLRSALRGVVSVFAMWPLHNGDAAPAVMDTIAASTERLVLLSSAAARPELADPANPISATHLAVEEAVERAGLAWTFLQPRAFATNTLTFASQIRAGDVVRGIHGDMAMTLIHEADMAAVAVRALTSDGHVKARYELSGPELLRQSEQVQIIGEVLGRPIRWVEVSRAVAREQMLDVIPESHVDRMLDAYARLAESESAPEPPTTTVEDVTGAPARTYRQWVADHRADFTA